MIHEQEQRLEQARDVAQRYLEISEEQAHRHERQSLLSLMLWFSPVEMAVVAGEIVSTSSDQHIASMNLTKLANRLLDLSSPLRSGSVIQSKTP